MFTGIIEELGTIQAVESRPAGVRLRVAAPLVCSDVREGDSICVNGVCLTAVEIRGASFGADVSPESLRRSSLAVIRAGTKVNLERALLPTTRLGGHIVQGHVDAMGEILALDLLGGDNWWLRLRVPPEIDRYLVFKGSLAIDGISLTLAEVAPGSVAVTVIPHTYQSTNLAQRRPGDKVNLEVDVLAKYVEKMLSTMDLRSGKLTLETLLNQGF
ncbi:MAG: riboflavin synthase [Acidobacteria bacterium]|nr:riboflavin synthase [Acidobacteriota bacterium]